MDILYTDTAQIRSCLLLDEDDLPDTLFSQDLYERELSLHLDTWLPDHATRVSDTSTAASKRVSYALQNYCAYWAAAKVAGTLVVSVPEQISDGKNMHKRGTDYLALMDKMMSGMGEARIIITEIVSGTSTSYPLFGVAGLAVDPVTG